MKRKYEITAYLEKHICAEVEAETEDQAIELFLENWRELCPAEIVSTHDLILDDLDIQVDAE